MRRGACVMVPPLAGKSIILGQRPWRATIACAGTNGCRLSRGFFFSDFDAILQLQRFHISFLNYGPSGPGRRSLTQATDVSCGARQFTLGARRHVASSSVARWPHLSPASANGSGRSSVIGVICEQARRAGVASSAAWEGRARLSRSQQPMTLLIVHDPAFSSAFTSL